jgi:hypothetical protein
MKKGFSAVSLSSVFSAPFFVFHASAAPAQGRKRASRFFLSLTFLAFFTVALSGQASADGGTWTTILWRNTVTGQNAVWYMSGETMTSAAWLPTFTDLNWTIVGIADFNGDGKPDIVWRNTVTGQNAVWYMSGETFISAAWLPTFADQNWTIVGGR